MAADARPNFSDLEAAAAGRHAVIAVAAAHDPEVLAAVRDAHDMFGTEAILFGQTARMDSLPAMAGITRIDTPDDETSAALAVEACRGGAASILMKGNLPTGTLMRAALARDTGLRSDGLLSHVMFYAPPRYGKLLVLTDGGLNPFPDLAQKKQILLNALTLMRRLGWTDINVSIVAAAEQVNPNIQSMVDAEWLAAQPDWDACSAHVIGPVGLDLAVSEAAAAAKHYTGEGAGKADLLLVPNYEVGNGIGKTLTWFGEAESAGLIVGATVPIVLVSRSDDHIAKRRSIALAMAASANDMEDNR